MQYQPSQIFIVLLQCIFFVSAANAADKHIILKAKTGNIVLEGELLGHDASHYRINSKLYGAMTVLIEKFSCIGDACPDSNENIQPGPTATPIKSKAFGISGSSLMGLRLTPQLLSQFAKDTNLSFTRIPGAKKHEFKIELKKKNENQKTVVHVKATGSSKAFSSLVTDQAQIGMSSRPVKKYELELATRTDQSNRLREYTIALDAITIIVSSKNKINSLSMEQVAKIFSGEIKDWSEVGGTPGLIKIYSRNRQSGIFESFNRMALQPFNKILSNKAKQFESTAKLSEAIAADTNGVGYTDMANAEKAKVLSISQSCGLMRAPTLFNIKTWEYPYTRKLYFYTSKNTTDSIAKKFVTYSQSKEAQDIIRSSGFVDQSIGYQSFDHIGDALLTAFSTLSTKNQRLLLKSFVRNFQYSNRLSAIFRFKPNSVRLDDSSIEQVLKLGPVLLKAHQTGKKIYLVGFSDSAGNFEQNKHIALLRAQQVQNTLSTTFSGLIPKNSLIPISYGELLPVACNSTQQERVRNRRVEIWVTK